MLPRPSRSLGDRHALVAVSMQTYNCANKKDDGICFDDIGVV